MYIDEKETMNTTFSDGAYGEGGYQRFCNAKSVTKSLRL